MFAPFVRRGALVAVGFTLLAANRATAQRPVTYVDGIEAGRQPVPAVQARPMSFLDMQELRQAGSPELSPDGRWLLYTLSVPDWKEARRYTDIYLVSTTSGIGSTKQLTFTEKKNEANPTWAPDGSFFVFSSNRDGSGESAGSQLYAMRTDGGEARKITSAKDGVGRFEFTRNGQWLIYAAGKRDEQQLWGLPVAQIMGGMAEPVELTKHATPIAWWATTESGSQVFFTAPESVDKDEKARRENKFTVDIQNADRPLDHLWVLDLASKAERRLTQGGDYSVEGVTVSKDAKWVGFEGARNDRYTRTITEAGNANDLYLLEVATGKVERLTDNLEIGESNLSFSPDGSWIGFSASNDFQYMRDPKIYLRRTGDAGGQWRKLGQSFDGPLTIGWWSADGGTIYFNAGIEVTRQVMALDVGADRVTPVTEERAVTFAGRDDRTGLILVSHESAADPMSIYLARSEADLAAKSRWTRLTNANPQVAGFALGGVEEVTWKSKDGKTISGVLVKPVGYTEGRRYPLIVQIHGGPAGADVLGFNDGYGSQIYAGAGYMVLLPNYRGSANYGERHRMETAGVGKYFDKGFQDIMAGVDNLIAKGMAHPDSMGAMGWSAGGHYSNWILTHTDRFKAISSGAGTMNWISMYAQSDVQRNRQWYMGGDLPYDNFDAYWQVSPLKYIKNAKTPTMVHVVAGDPRVPSPQSGELHMALKKLGV
ncbi:MAG: prolyl oligopeptidase family serine peptidase, partial [Gemmatimonadales bacterium]